MGERHLQLLIDVQSRTGKRRRNKEFIQRSLCITCEFVGVRCPKLSVESNRVRSLEYSAYFVSVAQVMKSIMSMC